MVYSVVNQHYQNWELIMVNGSTNSSSRAQAQACAQIDIRIKVIDLPTNRGISANTNAGIKEARGDYVALFDHDDLMHPCALHSVVESLQGTKQPDLIYTDEDKISDHGHRYFNPHCKPDWSPDLLRNVNYITHLVVVRTEMIKGVDGLRSVCDGAQDYDLLLRITDKYQPRIKHIARILYHWRAAQTSTANLVSTKDYIIDAGVRALKDHVQRNGIKAQVSHITGKPGFYELVYDPTNFSVIIAPVPVSKQQSTAKWLKELLQSLEPGPKVELIVGDWYKPFVSNSPASVKIKFISQKQRDYWQAAAKAASYPVCICFKVAALPRTAGGLANLAAVAADPTHAAVAPIILSDNDTIIDSGIVGSTYLPTRLSQGYIYGKYTYFGNTDWVRNVADLTTNIVAIKTVLLKEFINHGMQTYQRAETLHGMLPANMIDKSRFVVWAHTPFEYKGVLKPAESGSYVDSQLFKFMPIATIHVDNWGDKYARSSEA